VLVRQVKQSAATSPTDIEMGLTQAPFRILFGT
jgi:hypothetical protein